MQTVTLEETKKEKIEKAKQFFTISTKEAKKAIKSLKRVINTNGVLPILDCVMIDISSTGVKFTATDLESHLTIEPKVNSYGGEISICVHANYLQWFFNKAFEDEVRIEFIGNKCKLICGQFHVIVDTQEVGGFVKKAVLESKRTFEFDKSVIDKLELAAKFVSRDDLRPAMTGLYLHSDEGNLTIVSTDAHRLYFHKTEIKVDEVFECIVPSKGVRMIIENFRNNFSFESDVNHVRVADAKKELIIRKIDARFPAYKVVLPATNMSIFIDRKILMNYLSLACSFSNQATHQIKVFLKKDHAQLATSLDYADDVINTIPLSNPTGKEYTFGVNANFLYDAIICSKVELVEIKSVGEATKAMIIDEHILLMPLMLNDSTY